MHAQGAGPVVTRRATGPDSARLAATGERLARAAHPGVVQVVHSAGTDAAWELQLVHAGRPVQLLAPLPPSEVAAIAAAVAATLADLHATGLVHGHLDGSHVLIGAHGRPVLCGFGTDDAGASPHDDVAALGALMVELLGGCADTELVPERRWGRRRSPDWSRRSLLLLADHACAEPPSRRPSAARLAAAIASAVPDARLVEPDDGALASNDSSAVDDPLDTLRATSGATGGDRSAGRSMAAVGVAAVVLGGIVFGVGALRPPVEPTAVTSPTILPPTTMPPPPHPPARCPVELHPGAPVGCGPVAIEGTLVTVGGHRFEVGQPGDRVVVGDWDCDGIATAAALRPSTGEVFVFTTWTTGPDVVAPAVARIDGGVDLVAGTAATTGGDECDPLSVRRRDGSVEPIDLREMA